MNIPPKQLVVGRISETVRGRSIDSEIKQVLILVSILLLITSLPTIIAYVTAPSDRHFTGVVYNIPDHNQYFAWMRDFRTQHLAANRLTAEPNDPALFHLLWWMCGKIAATFDLSFDTIFNILRVISALFMFLIAYSFFRVTIQNETQRKLAFFLFATGGGLGVIWIFVKYLYRLPDAPFPFDIYTAEPNSLFLALAFPHFAIALSLIIAVIGFTLIAYQRRQLRYAVAAGACGSLIGLQHAYDILTIATVLAAFSALVWWRDGRFPTFLLQCGLIIAICTIPPGLYLSMLVLNDATWGGKLAQFDNAGAWTPNLLHLPILLGVPFLLACGAFRPGMLRSHHPAELLFAVWWLAHFVLAYLPISFQIHLLLGWQVPISALAARFLHTHLWPFLRQRYGVYRSFITTAIIIMLALCTNGYLVVWRIVDLSRYQQPYFLTSDELAALNWLADHTTREDVVLGVLEINQHVPPRTDARAFLAHWAGTLDYYNKVAMVERVLDPTTPATERHVILEQFNVRYIIVREQDTLHTQFAQATNGYLRPVFRQGTVTIYQR